MNKRIICLLLTFTISLSFGASVGFAADEFDNSDADSYMFEIDNIYSDAEDEADKMKSYFPAYENSWWNIPDYDASDMDDFQIIRTNMYYSYLSELGSIKNIDATVEEALSLYQDDGSFPNLDYWAYDFGMLPMSRHFRYLKCMIAAYQLIESKYYQSQELYDKVIKGMEFYEKTVTRKYVKGESCSNWWNLTIGHSQAMMPMLCIAYDVIPFEYIELYCERFLYEPKQVDSALVTGTNGTWYAMQAIVKGALLNDESILLDGIEVTRDMSKVQDVKNIVYGMDAFSPSNEGLQTDNSFHQHGPKYYYNYSNLFLDFSMLSMYLMNTKYEMIDLYDSIIDGIIDGWVWICHYNYIDINQFGRVIASPATMGGARITPDTKYGRVMFYNVLQRMAKVYPSRAEECLKYADYFLEADNKASKKMVGSKYFYRSDYLCHHRENWTLFNQLNSRRTNACEYNRILDQYKAYWLGFGHTFLYKGKDLYYGTHLGQPVYWDWTLIPGVTALEYIHDYQISGYFTHQNELFAGGISEGQYGMTGMKLTDRNGLSAKKAVFCFDDEFVSLGSGITSIANEKVNTAIEQRRLYDSVEVDGNVISKGTKEYNNIKTVLHYGIGYVFPEGEDVVIRNDLQSGSYSTIRHESGADRTVYSENMFTMYVPHGTRPINDKYCYITIPETDSENLKKYAENPPVEIISNTEDVQAVFHKHLKIGGAVLYKNAEVDFGNGLKVYSDSSCCLLVRSVDDKLRISVSNPYAKKTDVNLKVEYNGDVYSLTFNLPGVDKDGYDYGGKAVTKEIANG